MASSDRTDGAFSQIDGDVYVYGGSPATESLQLKLVVGDVNHVVEGDPYTEGKNRNKHLATPILRKTGDGNVTGSVSMLVSSFKGSTAASVYEVLTGTGLAASWSSTAYGDKKAKKMEMTVNDGSLSQKLTFNYCVFSNVQVDPAGADGLFQVSADFTDHESAPTVA